jgi:hypothetical protein
LRGVERAGGTLELSDREAEIVEGGGCRHRSTGGGLVFWWIGVVVFWKTTAQLFPIHLHLFLCQKPVDRQGKDIRCHLVPTVELRVVDDVPAISQPGHEVRLAPSIPRIGSCQLTTSTT